MDPVIVLAKFEVRSFTRSSDNSDLSFGWGANPQSWGRGSRRGSGMVPFERPHSNFFSIFTRFRDIAAFVLQQTSTPFFPTPPLVCPKFPHVPLGVGGWRFGYEERMCWANSPWN